MVCWWTWRLRVDRDLMTTLPPASQLLRDLDNCNSDPVAVASCFVERVRRAGCLPLVLFRGGSVGQGCPPSWVPLSRGSARCPVWKGEGVLGWSQGLLGGWHVPDRWVQRWACRGSRERAWGAGEQGHVLGTHGLRSNGGFPEVALFGFSVESRVRYLHPVLQQLPQVSHWGGEG